MQEIFTFFKNKKYYFLIFLFLVVLVLTFPNITTAVNGYPSQFHPVVVPVAPAAAAAEAAAAEAAAKAKEASCVPSKTQWCCYHPSGWTSGGNVCITDQPPTFVGDVNYGTGDALNNIPLWIGKAIIWGTFRIAGYTSYILSYVFFKIVSNPITTDKSFAEPWGDVRNLANMLIVLGFVVVGVATALRIKTYAAGQLLWKLIVVALFVNFSGLFCGLIIDASNLTTSGLLGAAGTSDASLSNTATISNTGEQVLFKIYLGIKGKENTTTQEISGAPLSWHVAKNDVASFFGYCILAGFVYLGVTFVFLYMSVILIARYVILIMLFILSPLAFAFWVFPATKKLWTEWWSNFIKWCFVGVFASFTLWLTAIQVKALSFGSISNAIISCAVILGFLYIGFKMTAKSTGIAAMAGSAVMGIAGGAAGLAMGASGKIAGFAANKTGLSRAGNWVKNKTGGALERVGLRQRGTTAGNAAAEIEARQKTTGNLSTDQQAKLVNKSAWGHDAVQNKVAMIKNLAKSGDLHKLGDTAAQAKAIAYAESYDKSRGVSSGDLRKNAEDHNYELAEYNNKKVSDLATSQFGGHKGRAATALKRQKLGEIISSGKLSTGEAGRINHNDLDYEMFREHGNANFVEKIATAPQALRDRVGSFDSNLERDAATAHDAGDNAAFNKLRNLHHAIGRINYNPPPTPPAPPAPPTGYGEGI